MGFNLKVIVHVAGLLLNIALLAWCLQNTAYYATMLTLILILGMQIAALLRHVSATNRELSRFLAAVRYADFSQSFRGNRSHRSFRELGEAFDAVIERFRSERSDKETQAVYLQAFVHQLPIAVFALQHDGRIALANQALQKLLDGKACHHLDQIAAFDAALGKFIEQLPPGRDQSFKLRRGHDTRDLKISCTLLRLRGQQQKLVSILDISSELESRELEAWQNLIRVMTHEIMNSLTPITSLVDTAHQCIVEAEELLAEHKVTLQDNAACRLRQGYAGPATGRTENVAMEQVHADIRALLSDAASATLTIGNRGQGLLRFVQSYRTLSRLPSPRPLSFRVKHLLQGVAALMAEQAAKAHARLTLVCQPDTLELYADPELLEQALINLVRNALDAVSEVPEPQITLLAELRDRGQVVLIVTDNGCGIEAENLDNIFVPFFTTKRGGSGIGMTIVRQIVTLNGGSLRVSSHPRSAGPAANAGTAVILSF